MPSPEDLIVTPAKAAEKGWIKIVVPSFELSGKDGASRIMPLLRRIGTLYERGGKSRIDILDLIDMKIPGGGTLRVSVEKAPPEAMKNMSELFETIAGLVESGDETECHLTINHPEDDCPFVNELKKDKK
jgi:hypothetical protein